MYVNNWPAILYIINKAYIYEADGFTSNDIQTAIWTLLSENVVGFPYAGPLKSYIIPVPYSSGDVYDIINDALSAVSEIDDYNSIPCCFDCPSGALIMIPNEPDCLQFVLVQLCLSKLDLCCCKGTTGPTGAQGSMGLPGSDGVTGPTGPSGIISCLTQIENLNCLSDYVVIQNANLPNCETYRISLCDFYNSMSSQIETVAYRIKGIVSGDEVTWVVESTPDPDDCLSNQRYWDIAENGDNYVDKSVDDENLIITIKDGLNCKLDKASGGYLSPGGLICVSSETVKCNKKAYFPKTFNEWTLQEIVLIVCCPRCSCIPV
jgi:hypothetical protein